MARLTGVRLSDPARPFSASSRRSDWLSVVTATLGMLLFLLIMEWLFLATGNSFLAPLPWSERLAVLGAGALIPAGILLAAVGGLRLIVAVWPAFERAAQLVLVGIGAWLLASSLYLLVDNFTTTLFGFSLLRAQRYVRLAYAAVFALFLYLGYRQTQQVTLFLGRWYTKAKVFFLAGAMAGVVVGALAVRGSERGSAFAGPEHPSRTPNILLIGADGLSSEHMSVYGYSRETTPNLADLARDALVARRAFSNAGPTGASHVSLLSGRLPSKTGVFDREILRGDNAYKHLPGILYALGYSSFQLTIRQHADTIDLNMRHSFDTANLRRSDSPLSSPVLDRWIGEQGAYFLRHTWERIYERVGHTYRVPERLRARLSRFVADRRGAGRVFIWRETDGSAYDETTIDLLLSRLASEPEPFLAHVFLLGTHGPRFFPENRVFSAGKEQTGPWMPDFYHDAIREVDGQVGRVFAFLEETGLLERTVVVFYSDHAQQRSTTERVPLIIRFPGGDHMGTLEENVQNTDIAPTILDYMGLTIPGWMMGRSLIGGRIDACRWIAGFHPNDAFYQEMLASGRSTAARVGRVTLIHCNRVFVYDNLSGSLQEREVGRTSPGCGDCPVPGAQAARAYARTLADSL